MQILERLAIRASLIVGSIVISFSPAFGAEAARIKAEDYAIDAQLTPKTHRLEARVKVKFTALVDSNFASFELNNALRVSKITDSDGRVLASERIAQENAVRVTFPAPLVKGTSITLIFYYGGTLANADDSPVEGLKLAYIGEDATYLLYPGRWFPVINYGIDRFTSTVKISAPVGTTIIGSGGLATSAVSPSGRVEASFSWSKPSFPGTIIAGPLAETIVSGGKVKVYVRAEQKQFARAYGEAAAKELDYFSNLYGAGSPSVLNVVELPNDTVPTWWAPEMALLAARDINENANFQILANCVARQWWGGVVGPAGKNEQWLVDGGARAAEIDYTQHAVGEQAFEDEARDMAVGALAYDTIPLATIGNLDSFSPQFEALSTDKGGMIFHMLRWVIGDAAFDKTIRDLMTHFDGRPISVSDLETLAEQNSRENLAAFFAQWVRHKGAPEFELKYTVLQDKNGFRIAGHITQDINLFHMPLELRVDTDAQPEMKRVDVAGTHSSFELETSAKPLRVLLDPRNWVLKQSPELKARVAIRHGQELTAEGSLSDALAEFKKALEIKGKSSLAHYRIADVYYLQRNYPAAIAEYQASLGGDADPRWTAVWSHLQLGKVFDLGGERKHAINEYRLALQTNDNTQGALEEAGKYLDKPYQRDRPAQR